MTDSGGTAPFDELAAKARRVHDAVTAVRGRAESADGRVAIEVDATGRITELSITDVALTRGAESLSTIIAATQRMACEEAESAAQVLRDELAADPRVAQIIDKLGTEATAAQHHRARDEEEDLHYANMPILRDA